LRWKFCGLLITRFYYLSGKARFVGVDSGARESIVEMNGMGGSIDSVAKDFARIESLLTPGEINLRSLDRLIAEILSLPNEARAILADKLIESLEFDINTIIQSAWSSEAKKTPR
jgi:hypothetical protein